MCPAGITQTVYAPFVPTSIPGCQLWLRADLGITISTGVSQWNDQSGTGHNVTQATTGNQPTYFTSGGPNNLPYINFGAGGTTVGLFNAGASPISATNCTLFIVLQTTNPGLASFQFAMGFGVSNGIQMGVPDNSARSLYFGGIGAAADGPPSSSWEIWGATASSAPLQTFYLNGVLRTLTPNNVVAIAATNQISVGNFSAGGSFSWAGNIAECIAFNTILSAAQIAEVNNYLNAKYNIP